MYCGAGPLRKPEVTLWSGGEGGLTIFPAKAGFPEVALWPVGDEVVIVNFLKIPAQEEIPFSH